MAGSKQANRATGEAEDSRIQARLPRLLAALAQGKRLEPGVREGYCLGAMAVSGDEVRRLVSRDLISPAGGGAFAINDQGRAWLRRARSVRRQQVAARAGQAQALTVHTRFRDQHVELKRTSGGPGGDGRVAEGEACWVNLAESPLGWLHRRRDRHGRPLISARQLQAGERLRSEFELAGLSPRVTATWDGVPANLRKAAGYRGLDPTEAQIEAHKRFKRAMAALGPGLSDVAIHTCCLMEGLADCERHLGWPPRSGKVVLTLALDRLMEHYRIEKNNQNGKKFLTIVTILAIIITKMDNWVWR